MFIKIDRIPSFDLRHSLFDIRFFRVSFSIKLAAFQAGGGAFMRNSTVQSAHFQSIALARINLQDDTFRITTRADVNNLLGSLQYDGLLTPPLLIRKNSNFVIVSGLFIQ